LLTEKHDPRVFGTKSLDSFLKRMRHGYANFEVPLEPTESCACDFKWAKKIGLLITCLVIITIYIPMKLLKYVYYTLVCGSFAVNVDYIHWRSLKTFETGMEFLANS